MTVACFRAISNCHVFPLFFESATSQNDSINQDFERMGTGRDAVFLPSFRKRKYSLCSATFFKLNQKHTSNSGRANTSNTAFFLAAEKNDILDNSFLVPRTEDVWSRQDGRPANFVRGFRYSPLSRKFKIGGTYPAAKVCCRKCADHGSEPTPCKH